METAGPSSDQRNTCMSVRYGRRATKNSLTEALHKSAVAVHSLNFCALAVLPVDTQVISFLMSKRTYDLCGILVRSKSYISISSLPFRFTMSLI